MRGIIEGMLGGAMPVLYDAILCCEELCDTLSVLCDAVCYCSGAVQYCGKLKIH
jgi:hypothetical protein